MTPLRAALLALAVAPAGAGAVECRDVSFEDAPYTLCEVDTRAETLRLFLDDAKGQPYGDFRSVEAENGPLAFGMNAGMYHEDRRPVGLFRQGGEDLAPLVTQEGPGNFGMLPNGVLCLSDEGAFVIESRAYEAGGRACDAATQSGPMLVIDGALHPRFLPDSTSRHFRNGVGTSADGSRAVFAISRAPVTFHEFARLFRDGLGLPSALYLDGSVSRLYAPALGRADFGPRMGPIVGVLAGEAAPAAEAGSDPAPGG